MKWYEYLDIMSCQSSLYIYGKKRYTTVFGIAMSLTSFLLVALLSYPAIKKFVDKEEMNLIFTTYEREKEGFNLYYNLTDLPFGFNVTNSTLYSDLFDKIDPKIATLEFLYSYIDHAQAKLITIKLETEPCGFRKYKHIQNERKKILLDSDSDNHINDSLNKNHNNNSKLSSKSDMKTKKNYNSLVHLFLKFVVRKIQLKVMFIM